MTIYDRCKQVVHEKRFKRSWSKKLRRWLTWCNKFVDFIASGYNCSLFKGMLANDMVLLMEKEKARFQELEPDMAQKAANDNKLVIAGWFNPKGHPGHVNILVQGVLTWSKQFRDDVPICANVGVNNFCGRPVSFGFNKHMKPRYWLWIGGRNEHHRQDNEPHQEVAHRESPQKANQEGSADRRGVAG